MIEREITPRLKALFEQYPFVTVTGPRQSGKTTLCRAAFPGLAYANLEAPDQREFAESDPRGFLAQLGEGAIIDEVQHVPDLLSYLQVLADEDGGSGLFVLTGSEQFRLSDSISQSLAGRTALLRLLPFSLAERQRTGASQTIDEIIFSGCYPRVVDQRLEPRQALGDYFETYVERDVRRLGGVRNLSSFRRFVRLCAGRVGQLVNLSSLGSDVGVSHSTAQEWLTILEASYIVFQLRPYHANIGKRLIKSPKLFFYDVGLASYLMGIEDSRQVATHPLRGALFENLVISETLKHRFNRGRDPNLSFYRDSSGLECDLFYEMGDGIGAIEVKSGATVTSDHLSSLHRVGALIPKVSEKMIVYGGSSRQTRNECDVVPISEFGGALERLDVEREISAFLSIMSKPALLESDLTALNNIYNKHIRPTLDALTAHLQPFADLLFRVFNTIGYVKAGQLESSSQGLLLTRNWEQTRDQYLIGQGFSLSDEQPIEIYERFHFTSYTGRGISEFSMIVVVHWSCQADHFRRRVTVDDVAIHRLDATVPYDELNSKSPGIDEVVAQTTSALMARIKDLSGA